MLERDRVMTRWSALKSERATWITDWRDAADYIAPRAGRFYVTDRNKGANRTRKIIDNTATIANRTLAAGMMSGVTSPARPWFRLQIADRDLMESVRVKQWLADVQRLMLDVFAASNTYMTLHSIYTDLGLFGTSCAIVMDDYENVIHHYRSPVGEFALGTNYRGQTDTIYREFERTVGDLVKEFGLANVSTTVRTLYDRGSYDSWVPIVHAIEPRAERDRSSPTSVNMPFKSCYFELGGQKDKFLRESGYRRFRGLCPRWALWGSDVYGTGPAHDTIGDIKALQHAHLRKANAIDYKSKPPIILPTAMRGKEHEVYVPGGVLYSDQQGMAARNAFDVNLDLQHLLVDIQDTRERIRSSFYADLFLMLANQPAGGRMTATEVAERHEEKLLMLGPVLERLHHELLNPLIDMAFDRVVEAGMLPMPPDELQEQDIGVEFVSILAQAQRAIGTNTIDRFVGNLGAIAAFKPDVLDKFDSDAWVDAYSDMLGVDPDLIVPNETVVVVRQQRAEMQQAAAAAETAKAQADAAAKLGTVQTGATPDQNLAMDLLNQFSGYNSPSGVEL